MHNDEITASPKRNKLH